MILASCRRHFDSNHLFGDLQFRSYPNPANTAQFVDMTEGEVADVVRDLHVVVFVHGYRNPLRNVGPAYRKLESELGLRGLIGPGNYDTALGFVWPGFETPLGFFPAVPWANRAASFFREFMKLLNGSAHTVDVQTHSLGARVALQALAFEHEVWLDNLMVTAPAVDNESLEPTKEFNASLRSCRRCYVYHSSKDPVLKVGYRIGALDRALGFKGPEHPGVIQAQCPEVHIVDCSSVVASHGGYRQAPEVYGHWTRVLSEMPTPRFEKLKKER